MLKEIIHEAVKNQPKKPYLGISPSQLGGCPRAHWFNIKGYEQTTPPNVGALLNFEMGNVWEELIFRKIDQNVDHVKIKSHQGEKWRVPELNLVGTIDYSIEVGDTNILVDCKTVNSKWFNYTESRFKKQTLSRNDFLLQENHHYAIQLGTYLLMAEMLGKKFDYALLVFVNKDNSYIGWEVRVDLTEELRKEIKERIKYLQEHLDKNTIPNCECEGWKVGYCNHGRPSTRKQNTTKKWVNTECCGNVEQIKQWATESFPLEERGE